MDWKQPVQVPLQDPRNVASVTGDTKIRYDRRLRSSNSSQSKSLRVCPKEQRLIRYTLSLDYLQDAVRKIIYNSTVATIHRARRSPRWKEIKRWRMSNYRPEKNWGRENVETDRVERQLWERQDEIAFQRRSRGRNPEAREPYTTKPRSKKWRLFRNQAHFGYFSIVGSKDARSKSNTYY
jgi:hypothetical protein